jgi:hypothetical protein
MKVEQMYLHLTNNAPDTVEVLEVDTMDIKNLVLADDIIKLEFFAEHEEEYFKIHKTLPQPLATYYLGIKPEIRALNINADSNDADITNRWKPYCDIKEVARIAWDYMADGHHYEGFILVPLVENYFIVDRETREIVSDKHPKPAIKPQA